MQQLVFNKQVISIDGQVYLPILDFVQHVLLVNKLYKHLCPVNVHNFKKKLLVINQDIVHIQEVVVNHFYVHKYLIQQYVHQIQNVFGIQHLQLHLIVNHSQHHVQVYHHQIIN